MSNSKKYEFGNKVSETGDSILDIPFEERTNGRIYIDEEKIKDLINDELDKRLGPFKKNRGLDHN